MATDATPAIPPCGLGIDAGGTQTRWALANASGEIIASGHVAGLTALQMSTDGGRQHIREVLNGLAINVRAHGQPAGVYAGLSGFSEGGENLRTLIANALGVTDSSVSLGSDVEIAYLDLYAPGEGIIVYAGTGSIAAFIDKDGTLHRAGGRGVLLDDAGGGYWIAREALRHIWRGEDEHPGQWRDSPMAREIFARIGGSEWTHTRQFVYGATSERTRGKIGKLALAVAAAADVDPVARGILAGAGEELARLGRALLARFGPLPITLSGRAAELHPVIAEAMRAALPESVLFQVKTSDAHFAAARIAANALAGRR